MSGRGGHLYGLVVHGLIVASSPPKAAPKSNGSVTFILFLVVIGLAGYFLLLRPQQQRARKQRATQSDIAVGDEVLTIGGIVGTVLDIDTERVTILTGIDKRGSGGTHDDVAPGGGSSPEGAPTRMVLVRNAIARKVEPVVAPSADGLAGAELDGDDDREAGTGIGGAPSGDDEGDGGSGGTNGKSGGGKGR